MSQIRQESVGHIERSGCQTQQRLRKRDPWMWYAEPLNEFVPLAGRQAFALALQAGQPSPCATNRPGNEHQISRPSAGTPQHCARWNMPERSNRNRQRARRRGGVATIERNPKFLLIFREAASKRPKPAHTDFPRQAQREQITGRHTALRREIGQVYPEGLLADEFGRIG